MPMLRSKPEQLLFVAVANALGCSPEQATRVSRNHRANAFQAQLVPALGRRQRKMLVSLWALPLSAGQRSLGGTVSSGSGFGSMQGIPRLPTAVTPNPLHEPIG